MKRKTKAEPKIAPKAGPLAGLKHVVQFSGTWGKGNYKWNTVNNPARPPCGGTGCTGHPAGIAIASGCANLALSACTDAGVTAKMKQHLGTRESTQLKNEIRATILELLSLYGIKLDDPPKLAKGAKKEN